MLQQVKASTVWNEGSEDVEGESSQENFITLPKPIPFTRAKVDAVGRRPAAVLTLCQFLDTLATQCKAELVKFGCVRHHHAHVTQDPSVIVTSQAHGSKKHHIKQGHHHHKESWDKRMMRLKVYQRAFSAIVIQFKAYSPALFYIKKNYEDMLSYRINQIKIAHYEKKRLHIQKHGMKQQMEEYQFPEYPQLLKDEKYLTILRQRIALQEEAIKVITGILDKMEQALSDHFERHRDLEEQIIMVDTEIINRKQKAYSMREKEEKEVKEGVSTTENNNNNTLSYIESDDDLDLDDPWTGHMDEVDEERRMVWIMAFAICHKDLEDAERKLNLYQTKYQHVVPRHEHENMKRTIKEEKVTAKQLADEKTSLEEELTYLKELEEKLSEDLLLIKSELTDLRTLVTPRPSWEQLGEFIQGGLPKWEKMIQGKSTKDVTDKLFSELRSRRGGEKFLQPLGAELNVLRCLRHTKRVPDRQLHVRDAALIIHDIWLSRKKALEENLNAPVKQESEFDFGAKNENVAMKNFPDYVAIYFENWYEDVDVRMEWTYNVIESCKRFSLDYRLTQFLNVLQGKMDEGIYFVTRNELFRVRNTFLQKSADENMSRGILSSNQFVEALELTFPNKSEPQIQSIVRVTNKLNAELNQGEDADLSMYHVTQLIDMRDDGFRGAFVAEIIKQFEDGRQMFIDKILEKLDAILDLPPGTSLKDSDPGLDKDVNVVDVYRAIQKADGDIDDERLGAALAWVFTGTSVLPGRGISTGRLINYIKMRAGDDGNEASTASIAGSPDLSKVDDDNFERAIKDVIREDDDAQSEENQVSDAQKKSYYRSLKHCKLRTVVKRLRGSALIPSWQIYDPTESGLPDDTLDIDFHLEGPTGIHRKTFLNKKSMPQFPLTTIDFGDDEEEDEDEDNV